MATDQPATSDSGSVPPAREVRELMTRCERLQEQLDESLLERSRLGLRSQRLEEERSRIEHHLIRVLSSRAYQSTLLMRRVWRRLRRFRFFR